MSRWNLNSEICTTYHLYRSKNAINKYINRKQRCDAKYKQLYADINVNRYHTMYVCDIPTVEYDVQVAVFLYYGNLSEMFRIKL